MLQKPSVLKLVRILGQGGPSRFMTTKLWQCKATLHDARHYRHLYLYQKNLNAHIWILYELKGVHLTTYIDICDMQLQLQENDPVLKRMRRWWFIYKNIQRKWSWSRSEVPPQKTSKAEFHQARLCSECGRLGMVWCFFPTINWTIWTHLSYRNNARRSLTVNELCSIKTMRGHTSSMTRQILEPGWGVLPQPTNPSDLPPSDFPFAPNNT